MTDIDDDSASIAKSTHRHGENHRGGADTMHTNVDHNSHPAHVASKMPANPNVHQQSVGSSNEMDHQQQDPAIDDDENQFLVAYLESHFSHQYFLSQHQQIATSHALLDNDLLISLCQGKSITYQLPAAIRLKGTTIVIMPTDHCIQREKAQPMNNVLAWWVTDYDSFNVLLGKLQHVCQSVSEDEEETPQLAKLIYISCKRFVESDPLHHYLAELYQMKLINQFVIEEIQCLESDRFPEYERLAMIRLLYPHICMTVLTNAITAKLQHRILNVIHVHDDAICVIEPSYRENIFYEVMPRLSLQSAVQHMAQAILHKYTGESGIIFCFDRHELNLIQAQLQKHGISSAVLDPSDPHIFQHNYQQWITGQQPVGIATQEFKFGIHKPNVRFVFHYSLPASIEEYIQDTNLAGRDEDHCRCTLFLDLSDIERLRYLYHSQRAVEQLKQIALYADNSITPRRVLLEQYCSINSEPSSGPCDNSLRKSGELVECNLSADVKNFLTCVLKAQGMSMSECIDLFRGVASKSLMAQDPCFGEGTHFTAWEGTRLGYLLYIYGYIELEFHGQQQMALVTDRGTAFINNPASNFKMTEPAAFPAKDKHTKRTKSTNPSQAANKKRKRRATAAKKSQPATLGGQAHFPSLHPLFIQYMYQAHPQLYQNLLLIQNHWMQQRAQLGVPHGGAPGGGPGGG